MLKDLHFCSIKENIILFILLGCNFNVAISQVNYNAAGAYSLRKTIPSYNGNAIQVRRTCDDVTRDIGFTSCGQLDTIALKEFVVASNPLSAITSSATAAYSLRKLRCAYGGNSIQVRRSSDNTTSNIGFTTSGDLDTTALKTFVGANNGFVSIWYDQSGNARNVSQTTHGNQPRIINTGVIERQNGKPAIRFIATSVTTFSANTAMVTDKMSVFAVAKINSATTRAALFDLSASGGSFQHFVMEANTWSTAGSRWGFYANNNSLDAASATSTNLTSLSLVANNTYTSSANIIANTSYYVNGNIAALSCRSCGTSVYRASWFNGFVIGNFNGFGANLDGFMTELIVLPSALSNTDRKFIEWTQGQYYNISGINLSGLPAGAANAFITTWYDQSGNARNLTQPAVGNQPKIINAGIMSLQNGRPAIALDGTSTWLLQSTLSISNPYTLNSIATRTVNGGCCGGYQRLVNISATGDSYGYLGVFAGNYATFNGNGAGTWNDIASNITLTSIPLNTTAIMTMVSDTGATGLSPTINGTTLNTKNGTAATGTGFLVGGAWSTNNTSQLWPGTISEFNIYTSALSNTRRTLLETNQAAHYASAISNSKYTPPTATTYNLFVNGVGRETAADSVAGTRSSAGMGFLIGTSGTDYLKDNGDYITAGINCPTTTVSALNLPGTVVQRWDNDWYVNKTDVNGNSGNLSFYFDYSEYGMGGTPGVASNYVLLYRTSPAASFTIVPGTTVSVSGDRVQFLIDAANVTTNYYYTIGTLNTSTSPLPIELLSFSAQCINEKVILKWVTASEMNNDFFTVEKSLDAINYTEVGKLNGAGNSSSTLHYSMTEGKQYIVLSYYRLKQTDFDGKFKYSNIISLECNRNGSANMVIYPNPNNGKFKIDCFDEVITKEVTIYNSVGAIIWKSKISEKTFNLDLSNNAKGIYIIHVNNQYNSIIKKLIIE